MQRDYIAMARPRPEGLAHPVRACAKAVIADADQITGINIGRLIGGALIVETIFALPGIGRLLVSAILTRDLIILQGVVLWSPAASC